MKEATVDLRRVKTKREAVAAIYKAIGFEEEAGTNLDALYDVLSAWGVDTRVNLKYWAGFERRLPGVSAAVKSVLDDVMNENRHIAAAYK